MEQLTACGWFEALPAEAAAAIATDVARCEASRQPLHAGLVGVVVDSRYLLAERPALELLDRRVPAVPGATGSRLEPPRGLVLDGERHDTERSIRWGHGTSPVAWRIDDFAHVPLHVGCIVVEQLPKPFFDAVQSFRLLADPRDVEKLLDPTT